MRRAIILAGGFGTRLRPYTIPLPKPLVPVGEKPILEIILMQLADNGFECVTLAINHQAELLKAFFGDGARWHLNIDYSLEPEPRGTMGPLRLIERLPEDFLVMNGDILTDINFADFLARHIAAKGLFTIAAAEREQRIDYGVLEMGSDFKLSSFHEKPIIPCLVSMGIYGVNRRILDFIPADRPFGFDELVLKLLRQGDPVRVDRHQGYWLDIGRPDDYQKAVDDWPQLRSKLRLR